MSEFEFEGKPGQSEFNALLDYKSNRPFAFRVLTPFTINIGAELFSASFLEKHAAFLTSQSPAIKRYYKGSYGLSPELGLKWHIAYVYLFATLVGTLIACRQLSLLFFPFNRMMCDYAPAAALLFLPLTFHLGGYIYDFPELFLLSLCLLSIVSQRYCLFYVSYVLASLNKESNVLIAPYLLISIYPFVQRRKFYQHLMIALALGAIIVVGGRIAFHSNPGFGAVQRLSHNLAFWLRGNYLVDSFSPIAPLLRLPAPGNACMLFLVIFGVFAFWRRKPQTVRNLVWVSLVINLPLFLALGYENEVRALAMAFPVMYLALLYTIYYVYHPKNMGEHSDSVQKPRYAP
jgi:hypothetical protein